MGKARHKNYGGNQRTNIGVVDALLISLPCILIMVFALSQGTLFLLVPVTYYAGVYFARTKISVVFILMLGALMVITGLLVDPFGIGLGLWELAIMLEVVTLILGYTYTRLYLGLN